MIADKYNKSLVLMAQGDNEYKRIEENLAIGFHGKVRTICRRAAGFYISAYLELIPNNNYGKSFMNQLRSVTNDENIPDEFRDFAIKLIQRPGDEEISGEEAKESCDNIISFFKDLIEREILAND